MPMVFSLLWKFLFSLNWKTGKSCRHASGFTIHCKCRALYIDAAFSILVRKGIIACSCEHVASPDPGISFSSSSCPSTRNSPHPCHWPPHRAARPAHLCPCAVPETFLLLVGMRGSSRCKHSFQRSVASSKEKRKQRSECKPINRCPTLKRQGGVSASQSANSSALERQSPWTHWSSLHLAPAFKGSTNSCNRKNLDKLGGS